MSGENFKVGATYKTEEIKRALGSGNYRQVVATSGAGGIRCVRFRASRNPKWKQNELWIELGDRRIPDAQLWIESGVSVPVFCGKDQTNCWTYLGRASANSLAIKEPAAVYTNDKNIGLVLNMSFKAARSNVVKLVRRTAADKKRAA